MGYGEVANKEVEFVNKQSAEASLEKTTETRSEQATTEKVILPDGKEQDGYQSNPVALPRRRRLV